MHRVKDHILAVVTTRMAGDDPATAADHDLVDIAPQPDIAVAISDRHGIIVGLVAHQCLRTDPPARLVAGIEGCGRKFGHGLKIPLQPLPDRLTVTAQSLRLSLAALLFETEVERVPRRELRHPLPGSACLHA